MYTLYFYVWAFKVLLQASAKYFSYVLTTKFGPIDNRWHFSISSRHSFSARCSSVASAPTPHRMSTTWKSRPSLLQNSLSSGKASLTKMLRSNFISLKVELMKILTNDDGIGGRSFNEPRRINSGVGAVGSDLVTFLVVAMAVPSFEESRRRCLIGALMDTICLTLCADF